jgi:protein-disulfide isomerase
MTGGLVLEPDPPISGRDHILGSPDAPITLLEYGDYECPYCGQAYYVVRELRDLLGDRLRLVFRNFPLTTVHPHAQHAAEAAEAAGGQRHFREMHDTLFEHQNQLTDRHLKLYASQIGLDMARFNGEMSAHTWAPRVREDFLSGVRSGVNGTPTFFINGVRHDGLVDVLSLQMAIEGAA